MVIILQKFDAFDRHEIPNIRLCNPNKAQIGILNGCYNMELSLRFNEMSEFTFTVPYSIDDKLFPYYDKIQSKRLILIDSIGYFIINTVTEENDGKVNVKNVTAYSLEAELNYKKINLFSGTYKFYDVFNPKDTLLYQIVQSVPNWSIGQVDVDLISKYRTFDIPDSTVYSFLMNDVENSYECVFVFDTINRVINAYSLSSLTKKTDIFLSFDNLLHSVEVEEMSDEIVTALNVYGGGDLSIHRVNPLGTATIYNFDYYKNTNWMSQSLINALNNWENKIASNQSTYARLLTNRSDYNAQLLTLQSELEELNAEYLALEGVQKARVEQGLSISSINSQMRSKKNQIKNKETQITSKKRQIESVDNQLTTINNNLKFSSNFTTAQYNELNSFMIENTYQNDSFVQTSIMTQVEIQKMSQELYNQAKNILSRVAQPRFTFSVNSVNFLYLKEFKKFIDQLQLGCILNVQINDSGLIAKPILLEIRYSLDDPNVFELTFGNRYRLDDSAYTFSDLFSEAIRGGTSVNFDGVKWGEWVNSGSSSAVTEFINGALNTAKNNVINADNQEILINQNGLKGRTFIPSSDTYDPRQVWLTSNTLAFTKDNWETASLAVGEIEHNGLKLFGVVGDALCGKILAGENLQITTGDKSFTIDENGAVLNNAKFEITTDSGKAKIVLSPKDGIRVQQISGGRYIDKFYVDTDGNAVFKGEITANKGSIGGWTISRSGLSSGDNHIYSNGDMKFGKLTIEGEVASFDGYIYARNLQDQVENKHIADNAIANWNVVEGEDALGYEKMNRYFPSNLVADTVFTNTLSANEAFVKKLVANEAFIQNAVVRKLTNSTYGKMNVEINENGIFTNNITITTSAQFGSDSEPMTFTPSGLHMWKGKTIDGYGSWTLDTNGGVVNTSGLYCGDIGYPGSGNSAIKIVQGNGVQFKQSVVFNEGKIINFNSKRVNFSNSTDIYFWGGKLDWATVSTPGGGTVDAITVRGF